jgi:hypothetical protein
MWELMALIPLILWGIAGALTFATKEISKVSYGITWFCLMFELIMNCME